MLIKAINIYTSKNFPTGITETSTSVSSTSSVAATLPTCLPSGSQSATANTMVAILHDYTNSQVSTYSFLNKIKFGDVRI